MYATYVCGRLWKPGESVGSPGGVVMGTRELLDVGAGS